MQVTPSHVAAARNFCLHAHNGQTRKFSAMPYSTHPFRVAELLNQYDGSALLVAAAYLHDVLEAGIDTTLEQLREAFPAEICELVERVSRYETCLARYVGKLAQCPLACRLKLADLIANVETLHLEPVQFSYRYLTKSLYTYRQLAHKNTPLAAAFLTEWRKQRRIYKTRNEHTKALACS